MRRTSVALALFAACSTPDERDEYARDVVSQMAPVLEDAVVGKVEDRFNATVARLEREAEDGDDAVRKETVEGFHTLRDDAIKHDSANARQHAMLRDALDRNNAADVAREQYRSKLFVETLGELRGRDTAINDRLGTLRAMLIANIAQTNNALAAVRNLERTDAIMEKRLDAVDARHAKDVNAITAEVTERVKLNDDARLARQEAKMWDRGRWIGSIILALAGIIGAAAGVVAWFRRKKK
jgi:HD-GYP domain-containing protein (c-di-GMP phosphodiesterase class II)